MKTIITFSLLVLSASTVFAAGGVKINGDVTLEQGSATPRVLYFSNGSSQWFATPWSYKTDTSDIYYLGVECHYIVDAFLCQDIVDTQLG